MKRIISIFLIIITLLCGCAAPEAETIPPSVSETLYQIKAECFFENYIYRDINYMPGLSEKQIHYEQFKILNYKSELAFLIENGVNSGQYRANHALIDAEYKRVVGIEGQYRADLARLEAEAKEAVKWAKRMEECETATRAWLAMKSHGLSDIVCAGIMGNMAWETGGGDFRHLDWDSNGSDGYGLIQWLNERRREIKRRYGTYPTIEEQIEFMVDEMYGTNRLENQFYSKRKFNAVMNAETPEECAYYFAKYFERCDPKHYRIRMEPARDAYNYFTS